MKKLSIEEKAKAYDGAIEKIKYVMEHGVSPVLNKGDLQDIFPELKESEDELEWLTNFIEEETYYQTMDIRDDEDRVRLKNLKRSLAWLRKQGDKTQVDNFDRELKESEDERIRKGIIKFLIDVNNGAYTKSELEITSWLAWLEKQGNPADKIEPKFKNGQWIVFNGLTLYVNEVVQGYYRTTSIGGIPNSYDWNIDNAARLWTIQEAKDGDVLANDHHILILKELVYDWYTNGTPYSVKAYCGIKPNGNFELGKENWSFCGTLHIHPATKEQRDLLFAKMKEAGYEWDADKKELTIIVTSLGPIDSKKPIINHKEELLEFLNDILYKGKDADFDKYTKEEVKDWIEWVQNVIG